MVEIEWVLMYLLHQAVGFSGRLGHPLGGDYINAHAQKKISTKQVLTFSDIPALGCNLSAPQTHPTPPPSPLRSMKLYV